jgi:hypothetical protein
MSGDEIVVRLDFTRETKSGDVIRVKVIDVPESEKFPEGIKYRLHYGSKDDETYVRYDNSHGVHERHEGNEVQHIDFPGLSELYQ